MGQCSRFQYLSHQQVANTYFCIDIYLYSCFNPLSNEQKSMFKSGDSRDFAHVCFVALTLAGSLRRYLNTWPIRLVFKHLLQDLAGVNA